MDPQTPPPGHDNPYHFILNPAQPTNSSRLAFLGWFTHGPLLSRVLAVIGGGLLLMLIMAIGLNFAFKGRSNIPEVINLTKSQTEIVRLSAQANRSADPGVLAAAANTQATAGSQLQATLGFLTRHGHNVSSSVQQSGMNAKTDQQLQAAEASGDFDSTFTSILRSQLTSYSSNLKTAYNHTVNQEERSMLNQDYDEVQLLLKQWPTGKSAE